MAARPCKSEESHVECDGQRLQCGFAVTTPTVSCLRLPDLTLWNGPAVGYAVYWSLFSLIVTYLPGWTHRLVLTSLIWHFLPGLRRSCVFSSFLFLICYGKLAVLKMKSGCAVADHPAQPPAAHLGTEEREKREIIQALFSEMNRNEGADAGTRRSSVRVI